MPHVEQGHEFIERGFILRGSEAVDVPEQQEGFDGGQIPPELILLAEHQREDPPVGVLALGGVKARYARAP